MTDAVAKIRYLTATAPLQRSEKDLVELKVSQAAVAFLSRIDHCDQLATLTCLLQV